MNDGGLRTQTDLDELIGELAEEYAQRLRDGEKPDVEEYTRRHPEAAEAIRQILPALEIMGAVPGKEVPFNGEPPFSNGQNKALGDFEIVREIGRGGMGGSLRGAAALAQPARGAQGSSVRRRSR